MLDQTKVLIAIRNLELHMRATVEGFLHGIPLGSNRRTSSEFTEYRGYVGDVSVGKGIRQMLEDIS